MTTLSIPNSLFGQDARNNEVEDIIRSYAQDHGIKDAIAGVLGTVGSWVIPGAGFAALGASLYHQLKHIYPSLIHDIASVYQKSFDNSGKLITNYTIAEGALQGIVTLLADELTEDLLLDLVMDHLPAVVLSWIPFAGGMVAAGLDYYIAHKLTWQLGTAVSIYFLNGEEWIRSAKETRDIAKKFVNNDTDVDLGQVARQVPEVLNKQLAAVRHFVRMLRKKTSNLNEIRNDLLEEGLPPYLIEAVLNEQN